MQHVPLVRSVSRACALPKGSLCFVLADSGQGIRVGGLQKLAANGKGMLLLLLSISSCLFFAQSNHHLQIGITTYPLLHVRYNQLPNNVRKLESLILQRVQCLVDLQEVRKLRSLLLFQEQNCQM